MTSYLLCSPAMYHVVVFDTYEEAIARRNSLRRPDWRIYEARLMEQPK